MSSVLILIVIIAGLALFFDQRRKMEMREKQVETKPPELTEDELPTSATGRMRVQPVIKAMKEQKEKVKPAEKPTSDEDEALPEPFASGINKRPPNPSK